MNTKRSILEMHITIINPETKKKFNCPCLIPIDALDMDKNTLTKAYGQNMVDVLFDLLNHKAFRKGLAVPKLIISSSQPDSP